MIRGPVVAALGACAALAAGLVWLAPRPHYDPLAAAAAAAQGRIGNVEAGIPPQCYTKTGGASNPCWVCHTSRNGANLRDDSELQARYDFSAIGRTNHWTNLFKDRSAAIATIGDDEILRWIRQDNYADLRRVMAGVVDFPGWRPDLDFARGFDAEGFARDGSGWRALRYKPFPGTFWPTNGSADDVMIRLPEAFRRDAAGRPSSESYKLNFAILEAAVATPDTRRDGALDRRVEPVDEALADFDLDGDGRIGGRASVIRRLPPHYAGAAADVAVQRYAYPLGTEFLHSVRYVDPDAPNLASRRMKELRYAVKRYLLSGRDLEWHYTEEAREQKIGGRPHYAGNAFTGQSNAFGWTLQGYIEDPRGRLRLQTREEQLFCMGCHTGLGVTVDQSFAFPRKLPGRVGWGPQDLENIPDAPQAGSDKPEYLRYLERVGAGDEFRGNEEMLARFFPGGRLDAAAVRKVVAERGVRGLIAPSRERALALDKAYRVLVAEQSYALGRDALPKPAVNVHRELENSDTALKASGKVYRDGRLWLEWPAGAAD